MKLPLERSPHFNRDFELQYQWYFEQAGEAVAEGYLAAMLATLHLLATRPVLGRLRKFRHPELRAIRSRVLERPFDAHLIFYRVTNKSLSVERILHGARNLPMRLREPPGAT